MTRRAPESINGLERVMEERSGKLKVDRLRPSSDGGQ
jgi:hypothetical protein